MRVEEDREGGIGYHSRGERTNDWKGQPARVVCLLYGLRTFFWRLVYLKVQKESPPPNTPWSHVADQQLECNFPGPHGP